MLYIVATPIGNLGDMSERAIATLRKADVIASEDTRVTGKLLARYDVKAPQISFHEHNERQAGARLMGLLRQGKDVAVVSDAGTPGIADPGYSIIQQAIAENIVATMIPGPTAVIMAVVLSGLATHSFCYRGFTPHKGAARRRFFEQDAVIPYTLVYYESPHRLIKSLTDALGVFGDRRAALANDLTKKFERVTRGLLSEIIAKVTARRIQGEFVLVVEGAEAAAKRSRIDD